MRIQYVDNLKGVAILFVVMGHVVEKAIGITDAPFNIFYSSFHMPLFMFLSGLFALKSFKNFTYSEMFYFLKKKTIRILLPFVTVGGIFSVLYVSQKGVSLHTAIGGYWFLPSLFYCMVISSSINFFVYRLFDNRWYCDVASHLIIWLFFIYLYYLGLLVDIPFFLSFLKQYPFFIMGVFYNKYKLFSLYVEDSKLFMSICFIMYFCTLFIPFSALKLSGFFAIVLLLNLFKAYDTKMPSIFSVIGSYSLEIYVFHYFFIPSMNEVGYILNHQNNFMLDNHNFVLLLLVSFVISAIIVGICIGLTILIKRTYYIKKILFG